MTSKQPTEPGKKRTCWPPLLVRLLRHLMATAYEVQDEVLGRMPLRVDILLIQREQGRLSAAAERDLGALVPLLNRWTSVEFKGPTDALERGDLAQLVGCAFLWHSQQAEAIRLNEVSLIVLAPQLNVRFAMICGCSAGELKSANRASSQSTAPRGRCG